MTKIYTQKTKLIIIQEHQNVENKAHDD